MSGDSGFRPVCGTRDEDSVADEGETDMVESKLPAGEAWPARPVCARSEGDKKALLSSSAPPRPWRGGMGIVTAEIGRRRGEDGLDGVGGRELVVASAWGCGPTTWEMVLPMTAVCDFSQREQ